MAQQPAIPSSPSPSSTEASCLPLIRPALAPDRTMTKFQNASPHEIGKRLLAGGVALVPTDTVYGLAAVPSLACCCRPDLRAQGAARDAKPSGDGQRCRTRRRSRRLADQIRAADVRIAAGTGCSSRLPSASARKSAGLAERTRRGRHSHPERRFPARGIADHRSTGGNQRHLAWRGDAGGG